MDVLIIGGTRFVGRAISESLLSKNHNITLFHRGRTNPDFLPEVTHILGDRETDLNKLEGHWDIVIDTCGYYPRIVQLSVDHLKDKSDYYLFISTISVFAATSTLGIDEDAELQTLKDPTTEDMQSEENAYGGLKVLCENAVLEAYKDKAIIVRPGLIVGPHDPTNRFTYWLTRIRKSGKVLAPGDGTMPSQFIDVRDLGDFVTHLATTKESGIFNATGPTEPIPLRDLFKKFSETLNVSPDLKWASDSYLLEKEVGPWMEIPLWIPTNEGRALMSTSVKKSIKHGLTYRPLAETVKDTLTWYDSINGDSHEWSAGLDPEKEKTLLNTLS